MPIHRNGSVSSNVTMTMISFRAESASVHFGMTHEGAKQRSVALTLKLEAGEDVETSEKRSLKAAEWSISVYEGNELNAHAKEKQAIGFLVHHAESKSDYDFSGEACYASVAVESATFAALWNLVTRGRIPDWISITVTDMTYGNDPDGREKIWDVSMNRSVAVTEVIFRFPVASALARTSEFEGDPAAGHLHLPATSSDVRACTANLAASMANLQARIVTQLRYVVCIVALIAICLLFK